MPELPEVETVVRGLARRLKGEAIQAVTVRTPKSFPEDGALIERVCVGATVKNVRRRQKIILIELSTGWTLAIHLKMTGQLVFLKNEERGTEDEGFAGGHPERAYEQPLPHKHTHVIIQCQSGTLYFNDLRKFGWIKLFPSQDSPNRGQSLEEFFAALKLGPEPLGNRFTIQWLKDAAKTRSITAKQLLMDQSVAAGVGNIYADEALFDARINPRTKASRLTDSQLAKLYYSIKKVLRSGIKYGGTTMNSYRTVGGTSGGMAKHLKVYGRERLPCQNCQSSIKRIKLGGRSTHFCPRCQR